MPTEVKPRKDTMKAFRAAFRSFALRKGMNMARFKRASGKGKK